MRCCQLCGCTSWGPIGNPEALARLAEFITEAREHEFVRCDGCKSIARTDLLEGGPVDIRDVPNPAAGMPFPDLLKPIMASMPQPPTRTERLVHTLLRASMWTRKDTVTDVVTAARELELALDAPMAARIDPGARQPWLVLSFPAQEEFERWCTRFWDRVVFPDIQGEYAQETYELAVRFVKGEIT